MNMTMRLPLAVAVAGLIGAGTLTMAISAFADQDTDNTQPAQHGFMPSPADRAAFLDARIAALHAGLELTADQAKLWPAVDLAFRELNKTIAVEREKAKSEGRPTDPVARLQRMSENQIARGEALKKLADATAPLYSALTDDQKHRLPLLLRTAHLGFGQRHFAMNEGWRDHDSGWREHGDRHGDFGNGDDEDHGDGSGSDQH
jgi:zinc resistance-associated protein